MREYTTAITSYDYILFPFYLLIIFLIGYSIKSKKIHSFPYYNYFLLGLFAKVISGIILCLIYEYYYNGAGDTMLYYNASDVVRELFLRKPLDCIHFILSPLSNESIYNTFSVGEEKPAYIYDPRAFFVVRLLLPINLLCFNSYIPMTMVLAALSYSGIWRLYKVFITEFPNLQKEMAIAILFVPSVVFWGSGLLKDTITLSAVGWFTYGFYFGFVKKKRILTNSLNVLIASFLLANIKPYILFALIPGSITWLLTFYSTKIKSPIFKFTFSFIFLIVSVLLSYYLLASIEGALGSFSVENVIDKASKTQQDMKQDYNEGNSFDIGTFDGSISGLLFIAPQAINATLFRPYIWETKSIVMLLSSVENTILLWLTIFLLIKLKFIGFFKFIGKNSLLTFSILFSLFFAFSVGLSISNFGALVRLKIPCMPFFAATIFIITDFYLKNKERIKINKY